MSWPVRNAFFATSTCTEGAATGLGAAIWAAIAARSACSQARARKAVVPATITASSRKTMRLLFMALPLVASRQGECQGDPQAARGDRRAVWKAAAQARPHRAIAGRRERPDRCAGQDRHAEKPADQSGHGDEVDHQARPGKQTGGRRELDVAATHGA